MAVSAVYSPRLWPAQKLGSMPRRSTASRTIRLETNVVSWALRVSAQLLGVGVEQQRGDVAPGDLTRLLDELPALVIDPRSPHAGPLRPLAGERESEHPRHGRRSTSGSDRYRAVTRCAASLGTFSAPVAQLAEATASKSVRCGFESHPGHAAARSDPNAIWARSVPESRERPRPDRAGDPRSGRPPTAQLCLRRALISWALLRPVRPSMSSSRARSSSSAFVHCS